jgi:RND family efflux transporter MFP subunit
MKLKHGPVMFGLVRHSLVVWILAGIFCVPVIFAEESITVSRITERIKGATLSLDVRGTTEESIMVSGITESVKDVTLSLDVPGTIAKIYFEEGAPVTKDQRILEIESKTEKLEVRRRRLLLENKTETHAAAARVKTLKSELESARELFNTTGSVSKEALEKKELEYVLAVDELKGYQIGEKREEIEYQMAVANLEKRRLAAPFEGTIIELVLDVGESFEEHQPLVRMVDTTRCLMVCNLEEPMGRDLKMGQTVDLEFKKGPETIVKKGQIVFVSPIVDSASSLMKIKAEFDNTDGAIRPGVPGTMRVTAP